MGRLGEPHLAQIVVDSFMHDSKFKPSRTTVKLILDHYRSKKDPNGFRSIILRMRATRGTEPDMAPDMRIRKRKVKDLVKLSVQEWAMNTKTIHRAQALHEKTPRNAAIFDSVIRGCLEMKGVQLAVRQIRSAFREGHQVHQDTKSGRFGAPEAAKLDTETTFLSKWKSTGQDEVHYKPMAVCGPASRHNSQLEVKLRKMGSRLEDEELSFVEEGPDLVLTAREPMKPMHLAKMQDMIARLAYKFLAESRIFTGQFLQGNSDVQLQTMQMKDRLQSLMEGFSNLPSYEWKDVDEVHDQRDALNRSLHTLCRNTKPNDRDAINLMLAKISYNMLVSTSPPSIVAYNVLLAEFTRLGEPHLAQIVVDSFMHDSKFKPSRTTVKLILDHYRSKKDPNGFRSIILRMRATRGTEPDMAPDMRIRKRKVKDLVKLSVQEWAMNTKTIHRAQALHEKTPRNAAIFDSVIRGCLEMKGVQLAVRQIRSAFREGHQVHQDTLCSVIRACVDQANFSVGVKLLRNILSLWEDGVGYMATVYTEDLRQLIHQLLGMCGFDTSLGSKNDLPIKASWDALQDLLYYMHL